MSSKIKLLFGIITLEVFIIASSFLWSGSSATFSEEGTDFALLDTANIDRYVLGEHEISFDGANWVLDEDLIVDQQELALLRTMLQKMTLRKPVSSNEAAEVNDLLTNNSVEIQAYAGMDLKKRWIMAFDDQLGTIAQLEGQEPFFVYVPNFPKNMKSFVQVDKKKWRDRTVIALNGFKSLKSISFEYPLRPSKNFKLAFDVNSNMMIEGVQSLDTTKLINFFRGFQSLRAVDYVAQQDVYDSLTNLKPLCRIVQDDLDNNLNNTLDIYDVKDRDYLYGISHKHKSLVKLDINVVRFFATNELFEKR